MGASLKEICLYACGHCGTIRALGKISSKQTMHCPSCHHGQIPDAVAIDFKAKKFVIVPNDQT